MAVYTPVTFEQASAWLAGFDLGTLQHFVGIESGIENSNFFATTDRGEFVLTLFERLTAEQLPFYLGMMHHFAERGIPCPNPMADRHGRTLGQLNGRPAALVTRLAGRADRNLTPSHCAQIGDLSARMHLAGASYGGNLPNQRALPWWRETAPAVMPYLTKPQRELLGDELQAQIAADLDPAWHRLPRSAVHADLFWDNALFDGDRLRGVIDFYFAGVDTWVFDLAVTCNDWCVEADGQLDPARLDALLAAYQRIRPLDAGERGAWPMMLRAAALRFWLSRLDDFHRPRPAEMLTPKDPSHFERILRLRRDAHGRGQGWPAP